MRVLLTESAPGAADQAEQRLREAGYDISFCHPDHRADEDGCVVLRGIGHCPLRTDADIGAVIDARSPDAPALPTAREFGACCALRNHLPLIVTGPADTERFPWIDAAAVCTTDELVGTCEQLTRPVEAAVRRDAERVAREALRANGYHGDIDVAVTHAAASTAVFVYVLGSSDDIARAEAAGMVRRALRGRRDLEETVTVVMVPEV
ncbi:hypothetical protein ABH926_006480 [Catenulispora sp. GP43]|jgi:hypothetical protein|uniref:hypothetical protein n=1 Tax=Catenulispora sp. GP43 TaxID=3156263 RepID=UPI003519277A